jgi:hypothetical protein
LENLGEKIFEKVIVIIFDEFYVIKRNNMINSHQKAIFNKMDMEFGRTEKLSIFSPNLIKTTGRIFMKIWIWVKFKCFTRKKY